MHTVSLHGVKIAAQRGVYKEELTLHNEFEVDVAVHFVVESPDELPFADYTILNKVITDAFSEPHQLLEHFIRDIYKGLKEKFPQADKICVAIRKMNPPMAGQVKYAQVKYEG